MVPAALTAAATRSAQPVAVLRVLTVQEALELTAAAYTTALTSPTEGADITRSTGSLGP